MLLKCGHTICKSCAIGRLKNRRLRCPYDKKVLEYRTGVEEMTKNFTLLDLVEQEQQKQYMPSEVYCSDHIKKKLKFYCVKERTFACSDCLLSKHVGHQIEPAELWFNGRDALEKTQEADREVDMLAVKLNELMADAQILKEKRGKEI